MSHVRSRQKGPAAERMRRAREKGLRHLGTLTRRLYGRIMVVSAEYRGLRYRPPELVSSISLVTRARVRALTGRKEIPYGNEQTSQERGKLTERPKTVSPRC